jgi:serine/threonine-protein kinase
MSTLVAGSRIGAFPYEIVKVMDDTPGNMSEVYLATVRAQETGEESQIVLKLALGQQQEQMRFFQATLENEVERLRRLKHPGIVRIFPIQREGLPNLPYVAEASALVGKPLFSIMEYLTGGSLTSLIEQKQLDIGTALEIARSLAATLDYLHSRNQVHLDIKPDNILFRVPPQPGEPTEPVLIDFGIARDIGQRGLTARTLQYAGPERIEPQRQGDRQAESLALPHPSMDIYALGVVLYEMLTGRLPFDSRNPKSLSAAIVEGNPKPPSSLNSRINQELDTLVLHMLAREPRERPSALEVATRLDQVAIKGRYRSRYPNRANQSPPTHHPKRSVNGWGASGWNQVIIALLILLILAQLFLLLGTYSYWNSQITASGEGVRTLLENIRLLIQ